MEKASVPFLLDALRVCMGYKCQDHHREVFPSCTKPPLKKPKNNNPFCKILVYTDSTRASLQGSGLTEGRGLREGKHRDFTEKKSLYTVGLLKFNK